MTSLAPQLSNWSIMIQMHMIESGTKVSAFVPYFLQFIGTTGKLGITSCFHLPLLASSSASSVPPSGLTTSSPSYPNKLYKQKKQPWILNELKNPFWNIQISSFKLNPLISCKKKNHRSDTTNSLKTIIMDLNTRWLI